MKVGILTFHNADNYGAVLQCYALQEALKSIGHDVKIIDYRNPHTEKIYQSTPISHFIRCFLHTFRIEPWMKIQWKKRIKREHFCRFRNRYLSITNKQYNRTTIPSDFDCYIIGSDQLWNENCTITFEPIFFGDFTRNVGSKLYGYAISANSDTFNKLGTEEFNLIAERFNNLSFREQSSCDKLLQKTNIESRIDIDPTLLHSEHFWSKITNQKLSNRKYVLIYEVIKNYENPDIIINKAKDFAINNGLEIINITDKSYSVEDFVSLFKYASCVFTTSFHGTVFSLIFNTPLYAFKTGSVRDERYVNLLNVVGAESVIKDIEEKPLNYPELDFVKIEKKLNILRENSISYLNQM